MKPSQRFISGAACPKCSEIDSLLIDMDDQSIECVECHFIQSAAERDKAQQLKQQSQSGVQKSIPKKVDISNIIRVNQIKD